LIFDIDLKSVDLANANFAMDDIGHIDAKKDLIIGNFDRNTNKDLAIHN
jgi:hypothetical protein